MTEGLTPTPADKSLELVQAVITKHRESGKPVRVACEPSNPPAPLPGAILKTLKAPDGGPLPPSLAAWLAFDAQGLQIMDDQYGWISAPLRELVRSLVEEAAEELDEEDFDIDEAVESIFDESEYASLADLPAVRLPDSASQVHMMVFDGSVEPPVLGYEDETFWVKYKSFGEYVAHLIGDCRYEDL